MVHRPGRVGPSRSDYKSPGPPEMGTSHGLEDCGGVNDEASVSPRLLTRVAETPGLVRTRSGE